MNQNKFKTREEILTLYKPILDTLDQQIIPKDYTELLKGNFVSTILREEIIKRQGFPLISKKWIVPLAKWIGKRECVELMAGSGSLSYALMREGVTIKATDDFSWGYHWNKDKKFWTEIENLEARMAVQKYNKAAIYILSWPYTDETAYEVLKIIKEVNPEAYLIYIGEGKGGSTASDTFFKEANWIEDEDFNRIKAHYETWFGLKDTLYLHHL